MTIYLKDPTFIDWKTLEIKKKDIAVSESGIMFIEEIPDIIETEDTLLDCKNRLVTKSFVCGHHHIYSALARGMPGPPKIPANFYEILQYIWWRLDKSLDKEMIEACALVTGLYCAKNGVTFVIDHHCSPFAVENSLDIIGKALDKIGLSHLLCYEISDRDGEESREKGLAETERCLKAKKQQLVGLHASFTVGEELLTKAVDLALKYDSGIHIHTAEDSLDQRDCLEKYGKTVVQRLSQAGVLNLPKTILAHCVHLSDKEKKVVKDSGVYIVQNTESNLNNNVGVTGYNDMGNNIFLGTDGMHSDLLRSLKSSYFVGQGTEQLDMKAAYLRLRNASNYIEKAKFIGDRDNNLVILDYDSPTELNSENFLGHIVFGIDSRHVESVISSGRLIVKDRKLLTADEDDILLFSRENALRLWSKL